MSKKRPELGQNFVKKLYRWRSRQRKPFSKSSVARVRSPLAGTTAIAGTDTRAIAYTRLNPFVSSPEPLRPHQQFYDWLIRPAEAELQRSGIKTLVFVLDGVLRGVPMAALHDRQQYLIEKYNIALNPGLLLVNPLTLSPDKLRILAGGAIGSPQYLSNALVGTRPVYCRSNDLMTKLYSALNSPGVTKAEALCYSQLSLWRSPQYQHPFYWAAFVLVGNWL